MSKYFAFLYLFFFFYVQNIDAQIPQLWGMTSTGGIPYKTARPYGTIFKINLDGSGFDVTHSFDGYTGEAPNGNLIQASNGLLYGLTSIGGKNGAGIIFSIDPSNLNYVDEYDFDNTHGAEPFGSLVQDSNGILYGMTYSGGTYTDGVVFCFNPANNSYYDLHDFNFTDGAEPYFGSLIQATNGILYGLTNKGGSGSIGYGVIFSLNPSDSVFQVLYNFDGTNGQYPYGSLMQAANGKLYGMCHSNTTGGSGVIFSFNPDSNSYKALYTFGNPAQAYPYGNLLQMGATKLYGMTFSGGLLKNGMIFSFDIDSNTIKDIYDFEGLYSGAFPYGNLIQASNNKLYGMTYQGGIGIGNIFSYNIDSNSYTDIHDFNDTAGSNPLGSLIEITATAGINQLSSNNFQLLIYPNPSSSQINISCSINIDVLKIIDLLGQTIYVTHPKQRQFSFKLEHDGIYFAAITSGDKTITRQFSIISRCFFFR